MATSFLNIIKPTPFGFFDDDPQFQVEADSIITFIKRKLGDDILSVELTNKMIWACFEEAFLEYGSIVNQYQAKSQLLSFLGTSTGSMTGSEQKLPRENIQYMLRKAEPYITEAGLGGSYDSVSGSIPLVIGKQDYNLYTDLKDGSGTPLFQRPENTQGSKMNIIEIFHFSPFSAYRFFDTTSAINYLNNEFSFESFTPETIFYVLPVFEDVLRASMFKLSSKVRRSNYSYKISGRNLRVYPVPTQVSAVTLFMRVQFAQDPLKPAYNDGTIYGVSNLSNVPFGNLSYSKVNSIGRQWVRQYALALATELLGHVRSKFSTVPIPDGDLTLDGSDLVTKGREDKKELQDKLKEMLESLTYNKLIETEAQNVDNLIKVLRASPFADGGAILVG